MNTDYKHASCLMVGLACLIIVINLVLHWIIPYDSYRQLWWWLTPIFSFSTPALFAWIGILIRKCTPEPRIWIKALLIILVPVLYLFWTFLIKHGFYLYGCGERCIWIFSGIIGYFIPVELLVRSKANKGYLELILFLVSLFCYVGVTRVENHFALPNYQMLDNDWSRLFVRLMRFAPLALSIIFLAVFSFSHIGQRIAGTRRGGVSIMILAGVSFILSLYHLIYCISWYNTGLFRLYRVLSQPVAVYLLVVLVRYLLNSERGKNKWRDLFQNNS